MLIAALYLVGFKFENTTAFGTEQHNYLINTVEQWKEKSPEYFSYCPVISYNEKGDANNFLFARLVDTSGYNYYVSYPPFTFIATYWLHTLGMPLNAMYFQLIGLFFLICTVFFFTLVASYLFSLQGLDIALFMMGISAILFAFPVLIFKYTSYFFPELLGMFFTMLACSCTIMYLHTKKKWVLFISILLLAVACYTEWIGVLCCIVIFLLTFLPSSPFEKKWRFISFVIPLIACAATLLGYSKVNGLSAAVAAMAGRANERTGIMALVGDKELFVFDSIAERIPFATSVYWWIYAAFFIISFVFLFTKYSSKPLIVASLLLLLGTPVLHYFVFFDFSINHSYPITKILLPLSFIVALVPFVFQNKWIKFAYLLFFIPLCMVNLIKRNQQINYSLAVPEQHLAWLTTIKNEANLNEAIFLNYTALLPYEPQRLYTHILNRNLGKCSSIENAIDKAKKINRTKLLYVEVDSTQKIVTLKHITL